ncbi:hypothetical protein HG530_006566 [Fusarium avenaceum]|nr:hypothetical protein HG530_006566 [Fusarium avenaceum]
MSTSSLPDSIDVGMLTDSVDVSAGSSAVSADIIVVSTDPIVVSTDSVVVSTNLAFVSTVSVPDSIDAGVCSGLVVVFASSVVMSIDSVAVSAGSLLESYDSGICDVDIPVEITNDSDVDSTISVFKSVEKDSSDEDGRVAVSEVTEEKSWNSVFDDHPLPISSAGIDTVEDFTIEESDTVGTVVVMTIAMSEADVLRDDSVTGSAVSN